MTTISGLNIVIQQGESARDAQHIRSHAQDPAQILAAGREENNLKQQTMVQETVHQDKLRWEREKRKKQLARALQKRKKRRMDVNPAAESVSESTGRLLNTRA